MERSIKLDDVMKACLTCKWYFLAECICPEGEYKGRLMKIEDTCDKWELDDIAKRLYECL